MNELAGVGSLSALWLGILTSISPCPLATNIAAVSWVGRHVARPRTALVVGGLYGLGRVVAYAVLGALAVWSLLSVVSASAFLQGSFHRAVGPVLIAVGLLLLGVWRLPMGRGMGLSERFQARVDRAGVWGAFPLGVVFALSFCPVSAALFFGSLVPLAAEHHSPILLPVIYGVGTGLPVVVFAVLVAFGAGRLGAALDRVQSFERWARRLTAAIFILVGVYETLRSTLHVL